MEENVCLCDASFVTIARNGRNVRLINFRNNNTLTGKSELDIILVKEKMVIFVYI